MHRPTRRLSAPLLLVFLTALTACQGPNSAVRSGALGAAIGAIAGQAIGGDTKSTVIGTGIGTVLGYGVGNEIDKENIRRERRTDEETEGRVRREE